MDREHPIPQEVSTYEFRLVGDMTIKQFIQVAAGALISLVLYSSGLAPYVKWPLIIISFLSGVALAFFPIEDRPLGKWIILFVKAIYSPTIYIWDKNARRSEYFQAEPVNSLNQAVPAPPAPTGQPQTAAILQDSDGNTQPEEINKLDQNEEEFLSKLNKQFTQTPQNVVSPESKAAVSQKVAELMKDDAQAKVAVPQKEAPKIVAREKVVPVNDRQFQSQSNVGSQVAPMAGQKISATVKTATFSDEAAPPSPPTRANVVVGQVVNPDGKIIDGAILEIKDSEGRSVRALRSNRLGHFMIVTPLVNGKYQITVEKEGYNFEPVSFDATDRIIPPIAIWAKS